jgi:hypothetical protein
MPIQTIDLAEATCPRYVREHETQCGRRVSHVIVNRHNVVAVCDVHADETRARLSFDSDAVLVSIPA